MDNNKFNDDDATAMRLKLANRYAYNLKWYPSPQDLERIEEFGYLGISDPREHASLLGVAVHDYTLAGVCLMGILEALVRGKARAHFDVQSSLMGMIRGVVEADSAKLNAIKFALTSRFGSDENAVSTKHQLALAEAKIDLERRKISIANKKFKLDSKAHEEKMELEITKFARDLTPQEREAMGK